MYLHTVFVLTVVVIIFGSGPSYKNSCIPWSLLFFFLPVIPIGHCYNCNGQENEAPLTCSVSMNEFIWLKKTFSWIDRDNEKLFSAFCLASGWEYAAPYSDSFQKEPKLISGRWKHVREPSRCQQYSLYQNSLCNSIYLPFSGLEVSWLWSSWDLVRGFEKPWKNSLCFNNLRQPEDH